MKLSVRQMADWNCYAYIAEEVDEPYWDYFKSGFWWQLGNNFIKQYADVRGFEYCAENFSKYGETAVKQQLKLLPAPWESALDLLISEMKPLGVSWYLHGSAAMALWGVDVLPKDVNIIVPNDSDFERVSNHLSRLAIKPFERCEHWVMSGLGDIFLEAVVSISFHNRELEPFDMGRLEKAVFHGEEIYVSSLQMLRQDNERFSRPEMVRLIEEQIKKAIR